MKSLSIIIPVHNEENNLIPLIEKIQRTSGLPEDYEILFIDDGSKDKSLSLLKEIHHRNTRVNVIPLKSQWGKSFALDVGFRMARGDWFVTIDGDLQNDPADIPSLLDAIQNGYDIVSGRRIHRQDSWVKKKTSSAFNRLISQGTKTGFADLFSGIKCYRKETLLSLGLSGDSLRFAMIEATQQGYKVIEIPVKHHPRAAGQSKYKWTSLAKRGLKDLLILLFILKFQFRPRVFQILSLIGILSGFFSFGIGVMWVLAILDGVQFIMPMIIGILLFAAGIYIDKARSYLENQKRWPRIRDKKIGKTMFHPEK